MTIAEILPYVTALVAVLGLVFSRVASAKTDATEIQKISDQLQHIQDLLQETREDVRNVNPRVGALEIQFRELEKRLERVEEIVSEL